MDACAAIFRDGGIIRLAIVRAVLVAVLTVLIAPSIDMPETVLREHHVAPHSMASNGSGTLTVTGLISVEQVFQNLTIQAVGSLKVLDQIHSQTSLVLRC
jgi:hypothetical protein